MTRRMNTTGFGLSCALAVLAMTLLQGCGSASAAGTYSIDKEVMRKQLKEQVDATTDQEEKFALQLTLGMIDAIEVTVTLNEDGTATGSFGMAGDSATQEGTWSLDGNVITISLGNEGETPEPISGTFDGDDLIELNPPEGEQIPINLVLRRTPTA